MIRFRTLTWNCRNATQSSPLWDYLRELAPDVALLQEVSGIPPNVHEEFEVRYKRAGTNTGTLQRFHSALLVRGEIGHEISLRSPDAWVNAELERFAGNLLAYEALLEGGIRLNLVGVYSPAWPVDRGRMAGVDTGRVRLTLNRDVWVADLLWWALSSRASKLEDAWVVAGDFNLSETFDAGRGGPRGNREYLDRMEALGLTECLREANGRLTPTFRNPRGGRIVHQIDYLFVSDPLASALVACDTGDSEKVFGESLSDHLPILADFCLDRGK